MRNKKITLLAAFILTSALFSSCKKDEDRGFVLLSYQDEIDLGNQFDAEIKSDPTEYPILSKTTYPQVYTYVESLMNSILQSSELKNKDKYQWQITIIDKDVMNAFAVPGGKLYFYTGLMKYLDDGSSFAGVLAHEMAHVDLRHSSQQMTKAYGITLLFDIILGKDKNAIGQIAQDMTTGLASLKFSREFEYDADRYAMYFLAHTENDPRGIKSFFEKLLAEGKTQENFEFLSTHPSDQNRIDAINNVWTSDRRLQTLKGNKSYQLFATEYAAIINALP